MALTPDRPEELPKTVEKNELGYRLLSDATMAASRAFGIAFTLDEKTREQYKGYGIDLEKASGESHWQLPVPSVFVLDAEGVVQFHYVNPDYRVRIEPSVILAAAKAAAGK